MDAKNIVLARQESIAILTINRPQVLNILDRATMLELSAAVDQLGHDDQVRCMIITGADAELASACDLGIAADTAHIAFPHVRLGITPGLGGGQRLVRLVGRAHAKRIILSGEPLTATEAWQIGWVDRLAPQEQLWKVTEALARDLASKPRCAMQLAKDTLNSSSQASLATGCSQEALRFGLACSMAWGTD